MSLLWRLARVQTGPEGTFGVMGLAEEPPRWVTLERPWKNNEPFISCIPDGTYVLRPHESVKFGRVWCVDQVPNRTAILIHPANLATELEGCIALGECYGSLQEHPAVVNSRQAVTEFHSMLAGLSDATLQIRWAL